jgi:hypothetical protein
MAHQAPLPPQSAVAKCVVAMARRTAGCRVRSQSDVKSARDTSGESASVLLSHGADRRWSSCGGMSDWYHINSFALGERSLSRCNTRVPRRVPPAAQVGIEGRGRCVGLSRSLVLEQGLFAI